MIENNKFQSNIGTTHHSRHRVKRNLMDMTVQEAAPNTQDGKSDRKKLYWRHDVH